MAASSGSPLRQQRVPAWKRLGLKLKYAKEDAEPQLLSKSNAAVAPAHPIGDGSAKENSNGDVRPQKKRRISSESPNESHNTVANRAARDSSPGRRVPVDLRTAEDKSESIVDSHDRELQTVNDSTVELGTTQRSESVVDTDPKPKRKSVKSTTDTNQEDVFGASSLLEQWGTDQDTGQDYSTSLTAPPSSKKAKKQQRRAERTNAANELPSRNSHHVRDHNSASSDTVPEYVAYLQLFHADKQSWKFNKKKQNDLLKNLFNIERLPPKYDEAILQYIAGLQGAGARQRIIESATNVVKEIAEKNGNNDLPKAMESEGARRAAYDAALHRHLEIYEQAKVNRSEYDDQQIEEMKRDAEKGRRADELLEKLLQKELHPEQLPPVVTEEVEGLTADSSTVTQPSTSVTHSNTPTSLSTSKRKRRKMRTAAPSDDSTSNTSESEGDYNSKRGPATIQEALSTRSDPRAEKASKETAPPKPVNAKKIFDDAFLDQYFPKKQSYHDTAPKRRSGEKPKTRGFAYTHGTRADESASEDE